MMLRLPQAKLVAHPNTKACSIGDPQRRSSLEQLAKELNPFASYQLSAISGQLFVLADG
jgi:hypothetical protein